MNEQLIKNGIYKALKSMSEPGVKVIVADQNEPRPPRPYISFKIITGPDRDGWDNEEMTDQGLEYSGYRTMTVSLNFFGQRALEGMARVQSRLQWSTTREILSEQNLVFVSDSGVRDMSMLLETQTETRSQMDVVMRFVETDTDEGVGSITRVEIEDVERDTLLVIEDDSEEGP